MGLRSFFRGDHIDLQIDRSEQRSLARETIPQNTWNAWVPRGRPLKQITRSNALAVATAWSCVKLLADSISTLPLRVYRRLPDGSRVPAGPDQRLAQLLARPWPGATAVDFISQAVMYLTVYGEIWIPKYTSEGTIIGLGPLIHPDRMQIFVRGNQWTYALDGDQSYGPADIVLVRGLSQDGIRGMSPIQQASSALELNESLRESSRQFFRSGSRPSGVLSLGEDATEKQMHLMREQWANLHSSADGSDPGRMHRTAVLSGEWKYQPISFSMQDQEFLASREFSTREIAAIFGLPPWAIGGATADSLTYSTTMQQMQFLVQHSFRPICGRIEAALTNDPGLCPGSAYCSFDFSELLRGSPQERAQFYTAALNPTTGWMRRDEARAAEDLPPEEEPAPMVAPPSTITPAQMPMQQQMQGVNGNG